MIDLNRIVKKYVTLSSSQLEKYFNAPFLVVEVMGSGQMSPDEDTISDVNEIAEEAQGDMEVVGKKVAPLGDAQHFSIGRGSDSTILIPNETVSRKHASLICLPDQSFILTDLGSSKGTKLNGEAVVPLTTQPLKDRDRITFGNVESTFFFGPTFKVLVESVVKRLKLA